MISRRAALGGTAVAVVAAAGAAHLLDVDDDALRALGARPKALPDAGDTAVVAAAAADQADVVSALDALAAGDPDLADLRDLAREQLAAFGGAPEGGGAGARAAAPPSSVGELADLVEEVAGRRLRDLERASSLALVTVVASASAGLSQLAVALRRRG